jgi:hypothetical protein
MELKIEFMVFWVVVSCIMVVGYQHLKSTLKLEVGIILQNVGIQPLHYMAQQPRKPHIPYKKFLMKVIE